MLLRRVVDLEVRSRSDRVPVSIMWALKVMRSTIAATKRGSGKTAPHSLNGRLLASPMLAPFSALGDDLEQQFDSARVDLDTVHLIEQK